MLGRRAAVVFVSCLAFATAQGAPEAARRSGAPSFVVTTGESSLKMVRAPKIEPGFVLGEKLQWLREDVSIRCELQVDALGRVMQTRVLSVEPIDNPTVMQFATYLKGALRDAVFKKRPAAAPTVVVPITVVVKASRDAEGRLK
jgi:hypothetical protein